MKFFLHSFNFIQHEKTIKKKVEWKYIFYKDDK